MSHDGHNNDDPVLARARARVGTVLRGKWRLDRLLGTGGMAAVYAGSHRNGARGAIKMLHLELSLEPDVRQRFLREGYAANAVGHPGVVRALDDDVAQDGSVFLVLELLEGASVDHLWARSGHQLPVAEALTVVERLLAILEAAHDKGVIHRDVKPDNLFVCADGRLKLLDFGIARVREGAVQATQTGLTMGTPAFMPPEQALGQSRAIGPATDLWAAGAVLFTLLTGRYVHEGSSANELLVAAATRPAPSLGLLRPDLAPELVALVDRALAFAPSARWPSAKAMRQALADLQARLGLPSSVPLPGPEDPRPSQPPASALVAAESRFSSATTVPHAPSLRGPPRSWLRTAAAIAGTGVGLAGALLLLRTKATHETTTTTPLLAASPVSATAPSPLPVVSPKASAADRGADHGSAPQGQLRVETRDGDCAVAVGGEARGSTHHGQLELRLPAGEHLVRCTPGEGTALTQTITVPPEGLARATFALPKRKGAAPAASPLPPAYPTSPPPVATARPPSAPGAAIDPMDRRQ